MPVFNGFLFNARAKSADLATDVKRNQLQDLQNNIVEKAVEKIGPDELAQAEGRLQRNQDMSILQGGIGG